METKRSSFTGKIGFVLAAAGSAVGLGNIWRFPYLAAKYGGGIFLLVYIALGITFGFSLMIAEIAIGRKTGKSPLGAFRTLDKRFSFAGALAVIIPALILPYYAVIGGWVMKYVAGFAFGDGHAMAGDSYFGNYIGSVGEPIFWFALFICLTALVVLLGVDKGIEKVSKVMMPALIVLILFIAIYSMFAVDGAWEGVIYYIKPDFSNFSIMTVVAAMGQLFYSMSLAMGIMITFGSYMKKEIDVEKSVHQIEIFDTGVAFLAGLMIIPSVFAFGGEAALGKSGPSLMFVTLPKIFDTMPGGSVIGAIFFIMVFFAALTSSISLMETVVATVLDKMKVSRTVACLMVLGFSLVFGLLSSLGFSAWSEVQPIKGMSILDFFDFLTNSILMPIVALATCLFVGFFMKPQAVIDEVELSGKFRWKKMFSVVIRFVAPICILAILVSSVLNVFGVISI
ncbi:MAG: sodium-dependent transporter [Clostridia bacterium]|nr:sodium-dependent transporter [Clostridia bacterium]